MTQNPPIFYYTTFRLFRYDRLMSTTLRIDAALDIESVRARAKVLAREDRQMRSQLISWRRAMGLTQKQIADMMGVSQQAINKFERYDADPKLSTIRRYANAIGVLIDHQVTPDRGQSRSLAKAPSWDSSFTISEIGVAAPVTSDRRKTTQWGHSTRSELRLVS